MIDFELTEEQRMLKETFRKFADKDIRPACRVLEEDVTRKKYVDWDLVKKSSKLGVRTATIPEELGGLGLDWPTIVIMYEQLAYGDLGFAFTQFHTAFFGKGIGNWPEHKRNFILPKFLEDDTFLLSTSHSEPHGMTEYFVPYDVPGGGIKTYAEKQGDEYVINGTKQFCSNAVNAKVIFVTARTDKEGPMTKSLSSFLMPVDTPGLTIGKPYEYMGARMLPTSPLYFEDARLPADYLLGPKPGVAYEMGLPHASLVLLLKSCILVGGFQALYEESLKYAREREICGKPLIEQPTIKVMLAEMRGITEASRAIVWKLAWMVDKNPDNVKENLELAWLFKAMTCEWSMKVIRNADEIHGGMGTNKELIVEKFIRDIFTLLHGHNNRMFSYLKGAPTLE